jgi:hypothetical protein
VPWSDYPTDIRQFTSLVRAAAEARYGAAAAIEIAASAARDAGIKLSFQSYSALASLYGSFATVRNNRGAISDAIDTLKRTGQDQGITGAMVSRTPWSPDPASWNLNQFVLVTGQYTRDTPTGTVTGYLSHQYSLSDLTTVGSTLADLQAVADNAVGDTNLQGAQLQTITSIEWSTP